MGKRGGGIKFIGMLDSLYGWMYGKGRFWGIGKCGLNICFLLLLIYLLVNGGLVGLIVIMVVIRWGVWLVVSYEIVVLFLWLIRIVGFGNFFKKCIRDWMLFYCCFCGLRYFGIICV